MSICDVNSEFFRRSIFEDLNHSQKIQEDLIENQIFKSVDFLERLILFTDYHKQFESSKHHVTAVVKGLLCCQETLFGNRTDLLDNWAPETMKIVAVMIQQLATSFIKDEKKDSPRNFETGNDIYKKIVQNMSRKNSPDAAETVETAVTVETAETVELVIQSDQEFPPFSIRESIYFDVEERNEFLRRCHSCKARIFQALCLFDSWAENFLSGWNDENRVENRVGNRETMAKTEIGRKVIDIFLEFPLEYIELEDFKLRHSRIEKIIGYPVKLIELSKAILKKRVNSSALTDLDCIDLRKSMKREIESENEGMLVVVKSVENVIEKEKECLKSENMMTIMKLKDPVPAFKRKIDEVNQRVSEQVGRPAEKKTKIEIQKLVGESRFEKGKKLQLQFNAQRDKKLLVKKIKETGPFQCAGSKLKLCTTKQFKKLDAYLAHFKAKHIISYLEHEDDEIHTYFCDICNEPINPMLAVDHFEKHAIKFVLSATCD